MTKPKNAAPAPSHLSSAGKKLWSTILDTYEVDVVARPILQTFLESRDRRDEARLAIAAEGAYVKDRFGQLKPHPALAVERDSAGVEIRAWRALGFHQDPPGGPGSDAEEED